MERGTDTGRAAAVLAEGGLVAFPTETVYGLGADASSESAVGQVFAVKGRPVGHPLIVHIAPDALDAWASEIPDAARRLAAAWWPGPLTLILNKGTRAAMATTAGAPTIGLRAPAHPVAQELVRAFGGGIAAPSANRFGGVSPTTADHVARELGHDPRVRYLLDGGPCAVGVESTIVDLSRGRAVLLRPGGVPREAIEQITGPLAASDGDAPAAPGTLPSHYAPRARVIAVQPGELASALAEVRGQRAAVLGGRSVVAGVDERVAVVRALPDDPAGMARELYAALRELDEAGVDVVIAALPPAVGLGEAVIDRLRRAAAPRGAP
jgi:L-threonylcarbamoyladenylate synthase